MKKALLAAITAIVTLVATLGIGGVGAGAADARWRPTPMYYNVWGNDAPAAGKGCRGGVSFHIAHDPAKRGKIRMTVRSRGFTRDNCRVQIRFTWQSSADPGVAVRLYPIRGTKKRGKILFQKELRLGSGLAAITYMSTGTLQKPAGGYIVVP